ACPSRRLMSGEASAARFGASRYGRPAFIAVAGAWLVVLGLILSHSLFVSHDTLSNYSHVWYVAEQLRAGDGLPFHMPVLGHGDPPRHPDADPLPRDRDVVPVGEGQAGAGRRVRRLASGLTALRLPRLRLAGDGGQQPGREDRQLRRHTGGAPLRRGRAPPP